MESKKSKTKGEKSPKKRLNVGTKECLIWLFRATKGLRARITAITIANISSVALSLLFVWTSKRLVDIATHKIEGTLQPYIIAIIATLTIQLIISTLNGRLSTINVIKLMNNLRYRLFVNIMESRTDDKELLHTGDILNRMVEDVRLVAETICNHIPKMGVSILQLVAAFIFLLMLEPQLAWVLIFIMPIALLVSKLFIGRMRKLTSDIRDTDSELHSFMQESVQNNILIRSLEHTSTTTNQLSSILNKLMSQNIRRSNFTFTTNTMMQFGFIAGYLTAFIWGIMGLYSGAITFGTMTAFLQLVAQIQRPVADQVYKIRDIIKTFTSVERLSKIDSLPKEELGEPIVLSGELGIRFNNVNFTYSNKDKAIINNFNNTFYPDSCSAIMGETGIGKSTLMKLMLALITPDSGNITIFNDKEEVKLSPRTRCNFVYVPQGNTLMSGTIRENLLMGNPNATEDQLNEALICAVAEFVFDLPKGIDTYCGEKGVGLSEGQAQRIAIARGLLRPGSILLLDEPTSALDMSTEKRFLERISIQKRTVIVVTHRELDARFEKVWL